MILLADIKKNHLADIYVGHATDTFGGIIRKDYPEATFNYLHNKKSKTIAYFCRTSPRI